ncbi:hypothetical protein Lepto7376_2555 [[Leptolyngbya] sp. PCC 7376]|uniref:PTPA-CTERM sorting domain-containing protein n=1 Tax=[Leptolyngbya] sp. PCC 7376 TaxID=111781 RepID=UPI00029EFA68|nr:PTPA-CTERM sorting domain-containing protein [[Leptolyngbya] sp. PCC 7376]AFY38828.1 hypothetical protein Lepto7376_2555 [[Leptolyngbya] sp. PCC 7376]
MKQQIKNIRNYSTVLSATAIAVGGLLIAPDAHALTAFSGAKVNCNAGEFEGTVKCEGVYSGNDSNQIGTDTELFELDGWEELTKIDGSSGSNDIFEVQDLGRKKYSWSFKDSFKNSEDFSRISDLFFSVKGGPSFSAYLWDGETTEGNFNTKGIVKGNGNAKPSLSHISVYYRNDVYLPSHVATAVPTPAAVLPVLGGLFGIASKRKKDEDAEEDS